MNNIKFPCEAIDLYSLARYSSNAPALITSEWMYFEYLSENEKLRSEEYLKKINMTNNWSYKINKYGFRGDLIIQPDNKNIGTFGCSVTLGAGVEEKNTFASLVENQLGMNVINFGVQGASIQLIAKLIAASIRVIDFDSVIITLPMFTRFIATRDDDTLISMNPSFIHTIIEKKYKAVYENFSDSDFLYYASDSIQWIISELKCKNIKSYWGSWDPKMHELLERFVPENTIMPLMTRTDVARDGGHHGIISHKLYAFNIVNKYKEHGYTNIKNSS